MITRPTPAIARVPMFAALTRRDLALVESLVTPVTFLAGETLCEQGAVGREAFVIAAGTAVVTRDGERIAEIGPGAIVGEVALQGGGHRNATVTAQTELTALVVNPREFASLLSLPCIADSVRAAQEARAAVA